MKQTKNKQVSNKNKPATDYLKFVVFILGAITAILVFLWLSLFYTSISMVSTDEQATISDGLWDSARYFGIFAICFGFVTFAIMVPYLVLSMLTIKKQKLTSVLPTYILLSLISILLVVFGVLIATKIFKDETYTNNIYELTRYFAIIMTASIFLFIFGTFDKNKTPTNKSSLRWLSFAALTTAIVAAFPTLFTLIGGLRNSSDIVLYKTRQLQFWWSSFVTAKFNSALYGALSCIAITFVAFFILNENKNKFTLKISLWAPFTAALFVVFVITALMLKGYINIEEHGINSYWYNHARTASLTIFFGWVASLGLGISTTITNKKI